jgi:hypothetical protein
MRERLQHLKSLFMTSAGSDVVIRPRYAPHTKLLIATIISVIVLGGAGLAYNHGLKRAGFVRTSLDEHAESLAQEVKRVDSENQNLREALARASRALQMNETTYGELDKALKESASEIGRLREELAFYRNMVSSGGRASGVQVQSLTIQRGIAPNAYRYKLVIVQTRRPEVAVRGQVRVSVTGTRSSREETIAVSGAGGKPAALNLRNMQIIEGEMRFPAGFAPARISVSIAPGNARAIDQYYFWPKV